MVIDLKNVIRAPWTLAAAALLVGIAIVWDGAGARVFNGVGGVMWVASCVAMVQARWTTASRRGMMFGLVLSLTVILAVVVKPSDGLIAIVGFGTAGALVAFVARQDALAWSVLVPAAWLPVHLFLAIGKSIVRAMIGEDAAVRTDPPPTTAIVPLLMVLAAWGAAAIVLRFTDRQRQTPAQTLASDLA